MNFLHETLSTTTFLTMSLKCFLAYLTGYPVVKGVSPRERRGSLMMLRWRGVVQRYVVRCMVMPPVVVVVVRIRIVVVILSCLRCLSLRIFLILHPSILEPYFHLSLCQVEVSRQLPSLLFRNVSVEQELFL